MNAELFSAMSCAEKRSRAGAYLAAVAASRGCMRCATWLSRRYFMDENRKHLMLDVEMLLRDEAFGRSARGARWLMEQFSVTSLLVHPAASAYDFCRDLGTRVLLVSRVELGAQSDLYTLNDACHRGDLATLKAFGSRHPSGNPFLPLQRTITGGFAPQRDIVIRAGLCLQAACQSGSLETIDYIIQMWGLATSDAEECPDERRRRMALGCLCCKAGRVGMLRELRERWDRLYGSVSLHKVFVDAYCNGALDAMSYLYRDADITMTRAKKLLGKERAPQASREWLRTMMPEADDAVRHRRQTRLTEFYESSLVTRPKKRRRTSGAQHRELLLMASAAKDDGHALLRLTDLWPPAR